MILDYLIIGGGPSGLLVHNELFRYKDGILVESGTFIPTKTKDTYSKKQIINGYKFSGLNVLLGNPPLHLSEGNCIGGGSAVNSSLHHRAPEHIWAKWRMIYQLEGFSSKHVRSLYEEIEEIFNLSTSEKAFPSFYEFASKKYNVDRIPRWGKENSTGDFQRETALDVVKKLNPDIKKSIKNNHRVISIKKVSEELFEIYCKVKGEELNTDIKFKAKNLFICAGAGDSPIILSKLGYKHNNLGRFQVHPTARVTLVSKKASYSKDIVEPFQITEFLPYIMIGSSPNRGYLSELNFPYRFNNGIDFSNCINLYSMAPSENRGRIFLKGPISGLRTYQLDNNARKMIAAGLKIIIQCALDSKEFSHIYSPAGLIDLTSNKNIKFKNFINSTINETLSSVHIFSSAAAGGNRKLCPVNSDGSIPGISNVYLIDSSLIPTCPTVNPQATTSVFSLSLVRKLIKEKRI